MGIDSHFIQKGLHHSDIRDIYMNYILLRVFMIFMVTDSASPISRDLYFKGLLEYSVKVFPLVHDE